MRINQGKIRQEVVQAIRNEKLPRFSWHGIRQLSIHDSVPVRPMIILFSFDFAYGFYNWSLHKNNYSILFTNKGYVMGKKVIQDIKWTSSR